MALCSIYGVVVALAALLVFLISFLIKQVPDEFWLQDAGE